MLQVLQSTLSLTSTYDEDTDSCHQSPHDGIIISSTRQVFESSGVQAEHDSQYSQARKNAVDHSDGLGVIRQHICTPCTGAKCRRIMSSTNNPIAECFDVNRQNLYQHRKIMMDLKSNAETINLDYQDHHSRGNIEDDRRSTKYGSANIPSTDRIDFGLRMRKRKMIGTLPCRTCDP